MCLAVNVERPRVCAVRAAHGAGLCAAGRAAARGAPRPVIRPEDRDLAPEHEALLLIIFQIIAVREIPVILHKADQHLRDHAVPEVFAPFAGREDRAGDVRDLCGEAAVGLVEIDPDADDHVFERKFLDADLALREDAGDLFSAHADVIDPFDQGGSGSLRRGAGQARVLIGDPRQNVVERQRLRGRGQRRQPRGFLRSDVRVQQQAEIDAGVLRGEERPPLTPAAPGLFAADHAEVAAFARRGAALQFVIRRVDRVHDRDFERDAGRLEPLPDIGLAKHVRRAVKRIAEAVYAVDLMPLRLQRADGLPDRRAGAADLPGELFAGDRFALRAFEGQEDLFFYGHIRFRS